MNIIAKRKPDPRARSYALPAVRRAVGVAPNRKLREHVSLERCEYVEEGTARCENPPVMTRSVPATVKSPMRVQRLCMEHMHMLHPDPDILDIALALDLLKDDKEDMSLWDYHHDMKRETPRPDNEHIVLIKRDENGAIVW